MLRKPNSPCNTLICFSGKYGSQFFYKTSIEINFISMIFTVVPSTDAALSRMKIDLWLFLRF